MRVRYTPRAIEVLRRIPARFAEQILRKVLRLEHGLQGDIKRLAGHKFDYRLRSGD